MLCLFNLFSLFNKQNLQFIHIINANTLCNFVFQISFVILLVALFSFYKMDLRFHLPLFTL